MLENLRRKLDEIASNGRPGLRRIAHPRQQAVQTVAEFVKQRAGVVEGQQRRLAARKIVVVDDNRQDFAVERLLLAVAAHPGAGAFARPGEIIAQEQPDRVSLRVLHLEGADIRVVDRAVGPLDKADAE